MQQGTQDFPVSLSLVHLDRMVRRLKTAIEQYQPFISIVHGEHIRHGFNSSQQLLLRLLCCYLCLLGLGNIGSCSPITLELSVCVKDRYTTGANPAKTIRSMTEKLHVAKGFALRSQRL